MPERSPNMRRRSIPSYPVRARLWRLKIAGLAETARLKN
jgi:hypothetical protein